LTLHEAKPSGTSLRLNSLLVIIDRRAFAPPKGRGVQAFGSLRPRRRVNGVPADLRRGDDVERPRSLPRPRAVGLLPGRMARAAALR